MLPALKAQFATYPWTTALKQGLLRPELFTLDLTETVPIFDGFPAVVRGEFPVAELSLATFLQAVDTGAPLKLLPIALSQRIQHPSLVHHADRPLRPEDLGGKRIAVRSYPQTTGVWIRGLLLDRYGVDPKSVEWVTFEAGHVRTVKDPANCRRAPAGRDMLEMLEQGDVDAAIFGSDKPACDWLVPVIKDLPADERGWCDLMGYIPINHALVVTDELAKRPDIVTELISLFTASRSYGTTDKAPSALGARAFEKPLRDLSRYLLSQNLISRIAKPETLFAPHE